MEIILPRIPDISPCLFNIKISPFLAAIPLLLLGGTSAPSQETINPQLLTGNLRLTLKNGVWKLWQDQPVYPKMDGMETQLVTGMSGPEVRPV
ncbi:hypothetical protein MICAC_4200007 [Microcystis aeruginosa PCC 9443]|uniref:Uncharacterized protein n=1 Tax=Microcystis aeruginosa PCC 9443 TaxID=1160281 RepID=I4G5G6_MICAE|nr:hypothetical protein MICAC_4200007 [Microcystis aeruginosa PCC 9443]